jgi:hypothetical protein|tara:strand:- start:1329 stop:1502 length:174 start_codon:yes stop_codon:yes gene_type:complete
MLRKTLSALAAIVNAPTLFALRCTMPELNADASRQSRVLVSGAFSTNVFHPSPGFNI